MGVSRWLGCTLEFIKAYKYYQWDSELNYVKKNTARLCMGNALKSTPAGLWKKQIHERMQLGRTLVLRLQRLLNLCACLQ